MVWKNIILGMFLSIFLTLSVALAVDPDVIAEYTDINTLYRRSIFTNKLVAQEFPVAGSCNAAEVVLYLRRVSGTTGYVKMKICTDANDGLGPETNYLIQESVAASSISSETAEWVSFDLGSAGVDLSSGSYWIVCWIGPTGSDAQVNWYHYHSGYESWSDTVGSNTSGLSWTTLYCWDNNFKVLGESIQDSTTTTITAPASLVANGTSQIEINVKDSGNNPVQGSGTVDLSASDGTLDDYELVLTNGYAKTNWQGPSSGTCMITAQFDEYSPSGTGIDYGDSDDSVNISIAAEDRSTTATQTVNKTAIDTRQSIGIIVHIVDSCDLNVTDGQVTFSTSPGSGAFSDNPVSMGLDGKAQTTWTAGNTTGTITIHANYSCGSGGAVVYGPSNDSNDITIDYTDVNTTTTIEILPDYPYVGFWPDVLVKVKDESGNLVPGGTVQLTTAPVFGTFDPITVTLNGGMAESMWQTPASVPATPIIVTGIYLDGYLAGGNRYHGSIGNDVAVIIADSDSTGSGLSWMLEWTTNYDLLNDIKNTDDDAKGFSDTLQGWTGHGYGNSSAHEDHMKGNIFGQESSYMDKHDFTYFSGHGGADEVYFNTWHDNPILGHIDCYDSWGDKDCEWVALSACNTMSHASYWASTMDGLHLICGFTTVMSDSATHGKIFGNFLRRRHIYDRAHTIQQAWFLAGDQSNPVGRKMRVVGENRAMLNDYIWSQGYVNPDPTDDTYYSSVSHDVNKPVNPTADAGGAYTGAKAAEVGIPFQLDGSGTTGLSLGNYVFFAWDLDTSTNSDSGDWDCDGIDENNDDADVWGRRPQWVFPLEQRYYIRLMVIDDDWKVASNSTYVDVELPVGGISASTQDQHQSAGGSGGIEIVDNFNPMTLPTQGIMQTYQLTGVDTGYGEILGLAENLNMQVSTIESDDLGSHNTTDGDNEIIMNQYTGAMMFVNRAKAYIPPDSNIAPTLPSDAALQADAFLAAHGIAKQGAVVHNVTDICLEDVDKGSRTVNSRIPFQRGVNYQRMLMSMGQPYPIVGPGGKISVLMDENEVVMFTKICRDVEAAGEVEIFYRPEMAIADFHGLGTKAFFDAPILPNCSRIEIDNVRFGYYENDFVTPQTSVIPVYIFDLTCEDDKGAQVIEAYMSALTPPLQGTIISPAPDTVLKYTESIAFSGDAIGGTPPYTYQWESDVDGLLSTEANFATSSLSVRSVGNSCVCEILPHTISLIITDAYGYEATEYVKVTVDGLCSDVDHNGRVDFKDLAQIALGWMNQPGDNSYEKKLDFNKDSLIDNNDLCVFASEWLQMPGVMVGHWALDDGDGNTAVDTGTGGNACTLSGDANWVLNDPNRGICLDLDGNGDYAKTADSTTALNFAPNSFSISAWINPRTVTGSWRTIAEYDRYDVSSGTNWFGIWLSSTGKFHFRVGLDTKDSLQTLSADKWSLVTATYEASTGEMKLYINGQYDSSGTHNSSNFSSGSNSKLTIGTRGTEDDEYFDGKIDDVRIYNVTLDAEAILNLFNE